MEVSEAVLRYAVEKLNGIAGWLTLLGARCRERRACTKEIVDELVLEAGKLARQEALELASRSLRYSTILNYLASVERATWAEIKGRLEAEEGRSLPSSTVSEILSNLVKMSLLDKENDAYRINDPILMAGLRREPLPK